MNSVPFVILKVNAHQILELRHRMLRQGLPPDAANFPEDNVPTTAHFAAFQSADENAAPIACASFILNSWNAEPAWQLRGMATASEHQGRGLGRSLLAHAEQHLIVGSNVHLFWCNARVPAVAFYEKQGWIVQSEVFEIPTAGPHRKMTKKAQ